MMGKLTLAHSRELSKKNGRALAWKAVFASSRRQSQSAGANLNRCVFTSPPMRPVSAELPHQSSLWLSFTG